MKNANDLIQKLLDQIPKHKVNVKRDDGCSLIWRLKWWDNQLSNLILLFILLLY